MSLGLGIATTGLGFLSSVFGGASARKQQKDLLNQMNREAQKNLNTQIKLATPYYQAGLEALEQTKNFTNEMNRKRFQTNDLYDQARRTSLAEANRQVALGKKSTNYAFGNNQGRARGEANRVARKGIESKNQINLDWAKQTEADRMNKTQMYLHGMSMLNEAGYTGTNIMSNAYNNYSQQKTNILGMYTPDSTWSDLGGTLMGIGGNIIGDYIGNYGGNNSQPQTTLSADNINRNITIDGYQPNQTIGQMFQQPVDEFNSNWGNKRYKLGYSFMGSKH